MHCYYNFRCSLWFILGALVLYCSEKDAADQKNQKSKLHKSENVAKVLERLGNVRRLMASILFLNDTQVGHCVTQKVRD